MVPSFSCRVNCSCNPAINLFNWVVTNKQIQYELAPRCEMNIECLLYLCQSEYLNGFIHGPSVHPFFHFWHSLTVPAQYYKKIMQIWYCIIFYNSFNAMATTFRSLSLQKKQPTHYLVKFTACGSFQVRSRGFFKCDGEVCTFTLLYSCTLILYPFQFLFGGLWIFLGKKSFVFLP